MRKLIGTVVAGVLIAYCAYQFFATKVFTGVLESSLGVPVKVKRVHLKVVPFEFGIYGLKVMSPEGFEEKEMFSIPETFVRVNLLSLFKGVIQVQKISFNLEHVTVEKSRTGKISLKEFLDIPKKKAEAKKKPGPGQPEPPSEPGKKKEPFLKLQVDEVVMSLGKVSYVDYGSGQRVVREFDMKVENMILHDVTDMDSLSEQVVMLILKKIGMFVMGMQFDRMAQDLQQKAGEMMSGAKNKFSSMFQ